MTAEATRSRIELAHEPPLRLRAVEVTPALSEVAWNGERQTLQPRVMQVLVALARDPGQVVTRDELVDLCWEGRTVGDDAINRCIGAVRRLGHESGAFSVETLPRIGHRLTIDPARPPAAGGRWRRIAALVAAVGLAVAAWGLLRPTPEAPTLTVAVSPFTVVEGDGPAGALAASLASDIAGMLSETGVQTSVGPRPGQKGGLHLRGTLGAVGDKVRVRLFLDDPAAGLTLWSAEFEGSATDPGRLRDKVAAATIETVATALEPSAQKGLKLDPEVLAIHIRGSDVVRSPQLLREGEARRAFEEVVRRAPDFALGHGVLAVTLVNEARRATPEARLALQRRAEAEAGRAIAIDPSNAGAGYDALYTVHRQRAPQDLQGAERVLLEGLEKDPDYPFLIMRRCRFLIEVGRVVESRGPCQRALALRPMAGPIGYTYARTLHASGDLALATKAIERAARFNPDHGSTRQTRFEFAAFDGSPAEARRLLDDPKTSPPFIAAEGHGVLHSYLDARASAARADDARAVAALTEAAESGRLSPSLAVRAMTVLGGLDEAFRLMAHPLFAQEIATTGASFLMEPSTRPLRADPRFWRVAARAGLTDYWRATGRWPDFCGGEIPKPDCMRLASSESVATHPAASPATAPLTAAGDRQARAVLR